MLVVTMLLAALVTWRDRRHVAWSEVSMATAGRLIGVLPASFAMGRVSQNSYDLLFAAAVLAAVAISLGGWNVRLTSRSLLLAAIASGFISTVSAVGGPPMAIVYQNEQAAKIRGTLTRHIRDRNSAFVDGVVVGRKVRLARTPSGRRTHSWRSDRVRNIAPHGRPARSPERSTGDPRTGGGDGTGCYDPGDCARMTYFWCCAAVYSFDPPPNAARTGRSAT